MREEKRLTQTELAELAGVAMRYVQDIEACRRNPTVAIVQRFKTALRCEWGDLLDKPPKSK